MPDVSCRRCGREGPWRRLVLVVANDKQHCQKVDTGNFHCPDHEFPESAASAVARSHWLAIVRNFRVLANDEEPVLGYTRLFYWPNDQELPALDVHVLLPA